MKMNNISKITSILLNSCLISNVALAGNSHTEITQLLANIGSGMPVAMERSLINIANSGDADAQLALAKIYESQKNTKLETEWYKQSALNGNSEAQFQLGLLYIDGEVIDEDQTTGLFWLDQAAQQGHIQARVVQESLENEEFLIGC